MSDHEITRGDQALCDAYMKAQQTSNQHRESCTKGCEMEPPQRCNRGYRLRALAGEAWNAFEATLPHPVFGRRRTV